jgi:hypothetical protein
MLSTGWLETVLSSLLPCHTELCEAMEGRTKKEPAGEKDSKKAAWKWESGQDKCLHRHAGRHCHSQPQWLRVSAIQDHRCPDTHGPPEAMGAALMFLLVWLKLVPPSATTAPLGRPPAGGVPPGLTPTSSRRLCRS